jgi:hypothetical protein
MKTFFCTNRILAAAFTMAAVTTFFFACSKNDRDIPPPDEDDNKALSATIYEARAAMLYGDLLEVALQAGQAESLNSGRIAPEHIFIQKLGNCFNPSLKPATPGQWPKTLSLDFGKACAGADGRVRAGKMVLRISSFILKPGSTITISLDGYSVNGVQLQGVKTIVNRSTADSLKFTTEVNNGQIKLDTLVFGYSSSKTVTQTGGNSTPLNISDDVYSVAGTATLTYPDGAVVSCTIKEPLLKSLSCAWTDKGKTMVAFGEAGALIDYGNGICDDSATVFIGDKIKWIRLPR